MRNRGRNAWNVSSLALPDDFRVTRHGDSSVVFLPSLGAKLKRGEERDEGRECLFAFQGKKDSPFFFLPRKEEGERRRQNGKGGKEKCCGGRKLRGRETGKNKNNKSFKVFLKKSNRIDSSKL